MEKRPQPQRDEFPESNPDITTFYHVPQEEQLPYVLEVANTYSKQVDAIFAAEPETDWVVINTLTGKVIRRGAMGTPPPATINELSQIQRETAEPCVPFLFGRPVDIDDI